MVKFQHTEQEYQELKARYNDAIDKNAALRGEVAALQAALSRYRDAVEWVIESFDSGTILVANLQEWAKELRRRAGEGE